MHYVAADFKDSHSPFPSATELVAVRLLGWVCKCHTDEVKTEKQRKKLTKLWIWFVKMWVKVLDARVVLLSA